MRGLPPPPADVAQLRQSFDINGHDVSIGYWLFNPSFTSLEPTSAEALLAQWFATCLPPLYACMHAGVIATTCRLDVRGFAYVAAAPPGHGAWTGGQADNVATGLHWLTSEYGKGRSKISFLPGVPDKFVDTNWRLSGIAWSNLRATGDELLNALRSLPAPDGSNTVPGTLHRSVGGAPMTSAQFAPYIGVVPTGKVVTIRRRIPRGQRLSPL